MANPGDGSCTCGPCWFIRDKKDAKLPFRSLDRDVDLPGGRMPQGQAFLLKGTVVMVAAGRRHSFSKMSQDRIMLLEGHGVEADAHAEPFVQQRYPPPAPPTNLRQVHPIYRPSASRLFWKQAFRSQQVTWVRTSPLPACVWSEMPLETQIELGPAAIIELAGLRTPCVLIQVLASARTDSPFKCEVLGVVRSGGPVAAGDAARVRLPSSAFRALRAL